jgi:hypothetical protein
MVHRNALITAGSIAVVVLAAAIAVGANLGILNVADSRPVGKLSAVAAVQPGGSNVIHKYTGAAKAATSQKYIIKKAGTVKVEATRSGLRLVDVSAARHWSWTLAQTADKKLTVTFRNGSSVYTFLATLGHQGKIIARVDHPVTRVVPAAPSTSTAGTTVYTANPAPSPTHAATAPAGGGDSEPSGGGEVDD